MLVSYKKKYIYIYKKDTEIIILPPITIRVKVSVLIYGIPLSSVLLYLPKSLISKSLLFLYALPATFFKAFYILFSFIHSTCLHFSTGLYLLHKVIWLFDSLISNYPFPVSCWILITSPYQLLMPSTIYFKPEHSPCLTTSRLTGDPLPRAKNSHRSLFISQTIFRCALYTYTQV